MTEEKAGIFVYNYSQRYSWEELSLRVDVEELLNFLTSDPAQSSLLRVFLFMARPLKNSCDYFPHDRDMRNHKKVKAIRSKFGITGYAVWVMVLEQLTGNDGNVFEYSELEFELMSGDFGVSATEIRSVVDYCISLEMLFNANGFVKSESLDERLAPVYQKRGLAKELSKKQCREHGKFAINNTASPVVSVTEIPHSKGKEIKVKESKGNESTGEHKPAPLTVEVRTSDFMSKVSGYLNIYSKEMLREFFDYWTEMNEGGAKMRFEMQRVFDIKKRLVTWKKNERGTRKNGVTAKGTLDRLNSYSD